jgi:hypothetical protein
MTLARHIITLLLAVTAICVTAVTGSRQPPGADAHLNQVLFCAFCVLAAAGVLGFSLQFFMKRTGHVLLSSFFGFFAGIMSTNLISEVANGTTFASAAGYVMSYGGMVLVLALSVAGLALLWIVEGRRIAEPTASPNGGPAVGSANSGASGGPPG